MVASISPATAAIISTTDSPRTMPKEMKRRTTSTSAVARDIRLPVCCRSWKPKLRPWSLRKKSLRKS